MKTSPRGLALRCTIVLALVAGVLVQSVYSAAAAPLTGVITVNAGRAVDGFNPAQSNRPSRVLWEDDANFGSGGVVTNDLLFTATSPRITASVLAGSHIYVDGWVWDDILNETGWTQPELDNIEDWVFNGGVILINEDDPPADRLGQTFGVSVAASCGPCITPSYLSVAPLHAIVDGDFGTWSAAVNAGTVGHFGPFASLPTGWMEVAQDGQGNATMITRPWGKGHVILNADEGIFRTDVDQSVPPPHTDNEIAALNIMAYAIDLTSDALWVTDPGDQGNSTGDTVSLQMQTTEGDASPIVWTVDQLPDGLSMDAGGLVTGTPTTNGDTTVVVTATQTAIPDAQTFVWRIADPLQVTSPGDQTGTVGSPVSLSALTTSAGDGSFFEWSATGLPEGLEINFSTGQISGTPSTGEVANVTVTATPVTGTPDSANFTWTIGSALMVGTTSNQTNDPGDAVSLQMTTTGGDGSPITWSDGGTLPAGLGINALGLITGMPPTVGVTTVTITATPATGTPDSEVFDWSIGVDLMPSAKRDGAVGTVGTPLSLDLCANDSLGNAPTTAVVTGALPPGMSQTDCVISGTPTTPGLSEFSYELTDNNGDTSSAAAGIHVDSAVAVDPGVCRPGIRFSMSGSVVGKPAPGDEFGRALAAGDFNGDGEVDLAIGAPGDFKAAGSVAVFHAPCAKSDSYRITQKGNTPGAHEAGDRFGHALAAGDFDGDGYDDLAIGVPNEDIGSIKNAGAVVVMYGSPAGLTDAGADSFSQSGPLPGFPQPWDVFGTALATGDFNGDGFADLLAGSPGEDVNGKNAAGSVHAILGGPGGLTTAGAKVWKQKGPLTGASEKGDRLGTKVAAGDFNGDGFDDAVFAAPKEDTTLTNAGAIHVVRGSGGGLSTTGQQYFTGSAKGQRLGLSLATGEVTGDIFDELIAGDRGSANAGAVTLYRGSASGVTKVDTTSQSSSAASSPQSWDRFGDSVAVVDLDGDGVGEVAVGVSREDFPGAANVGAVHVYRVVGSAFDDITQLFRTRADVDVAGNLTAPARFGASMVAADGTLFVGATHDMVGSAAKAGSASAISSRTSATVFLDRDCSGPCVDRTFTVGTDIAFGTYMTTHEPGGSCSVETRTAGNAVRSSLTTIGGGGSGAILQITPEDATVVISAGCGALWFFDHL